MSFVNGLLRPGSSLPLHGWKPASAVLTLEPLLSLKRCLPSPSSLPEALHLVVTRVVLEEAQGDLQFGTLSRAANRKNAQVCTKQSQRRQSGILEGGLAAVRPAGARANRPSSRSGTRQTAPSSRPWSPGSSTTRCPGSCVRPRCKQREASEASISDDDPL